MKSSPARPTPAVGNAQSALNRLRNNELQQRQHAHGILPPDAIAGKTSAARLLMTTLGGVRRMITNEDLATFKRYAKALGSKLREGLTPQEVVDHSTPADRERARAQIHDAIPARLRNGDVIFSTSAGPDSKVRRHLVEVKWPGYGAAVSMPGTPLQAATQLVQAPIKIDCDCEHFRYRYRYICSVMGANAGRAETGFPKLTNPRLIGIACKHVLRVCVSLNTPRVRAKVADMIAADRARLTPSAKAKPRVLLTTQQEATHITQGRRRSIATTDEKDRKALLSALAKATNKTARSASDTDVKKALAMLQSRPDISAAAIARALYQTLGAKPR